MFFKSLPLSLSLLASTVIAIPTPSELQSRAVIAHDAVVGFAEAVPSGTVGTVYEAYQPYLKVINGCVPFPAVDAAGNTGYDLFLFIFYSSDPLANTLLFLLGIVLPSLEPYKNRRLTSQSGGLATSGSSNGGCSSSTGQIYVRGAQSGSRYGLMYSWYHTLPPLFSPPQLTPHRRYMPKDSPSDGLGHRHDWEGVIIWLSSGTSVTNTNILAVCPSAHGDWDCVTSGYTLSGTGPLIKYESVWPVNHSCGLTSSRGGQQPLIAWESLTSAAQNALETTDFGSGIVPFNNMNFAMNLGKATF